MLSSPRLIPAYLALSLFALMPLAGCEVGGNRFRAEFHHTLAATRPLRVSVSEPAGEIRVVGWDQPRIRIDALMRANSQSDLDRMRVAVTNDPSVVTIETRYGGMGFGNGAVEYTIHVPAADAVDVHTAAGRIALDGLRGDVKASTAAGKIDAKMSAVGGAQRIDLDATTGEITLSLPANANAAIDASATIGGVHNAFGSTHLGNGSAHVTLRTTTGEVRIRKGD